MADSRAEQRSYVVGVGYTGSRLLAALPNATGVSRGDAPAYRPPYRVVYTAPPAEGYLGRVLDGMEPPPSRFVYISTSGVYGDRGGALVSEIAERMPTSERATRRVEAERHLQTWAVAHGVALVILRVPGIYGPGRLGIERVKSGEAVIAEEEANPGNRIHVTDLVQCCVAALQPAIPAGIYNVGDGDTRSSTWFSNEVARQCGLPLPPAVTRAEAERTFSERRLSFLRESRRLDLKKMRDVLGVIPTYRDAADGIRASLEQPSED